MSALHPAIQRAYQVLDGQALSREDALALARGVKGEDILDLVSLANKVRHHFAAPAPRACSILNAKCGRCSQNCRFCAQSASYATRIDAHPLVSIEEALAAARTDYETGVRTFGYVTSGRGYTEITPEFQRILDTMDALHAAFPDLTLCVSLGILSRTCVAALAAHHVSRYNMNLQTNPARYAALISTTHTIEEKIATIRLMQEYGIKNCTGGIIGLGETWEDRIDMAFAIRDLKVEGAPLNVLLPIKGTPLEGQKPITPAEVAKTFALFRLINPAIMLKFCAGRETVMKDFQGLLMLSGLNSLMTGGYLTTRGRAVADDTRFASELEEF